MYLNLVLGNQNGFRNLTNQIQNLTSDVELYREEIINKIEVSLLDSIAVLWLNRLEIMLLFNKHLTYCQAQVQV